jgi:arsenite methyltransferase
LAQERFFEDKMPDIAEQWRHYLSVLRPAPGDAILDVGCNSGDAERFLLQEHPEIAKVVGVEVNPAIHAAAVTRWREDGSPPQIDFRCADARALPFPDISFQRALCVEMLEWVVPPVAGLEEIRRVLAPGGTALIVHTDYDTQLFHAADRDLNRKVLKAFVDSGPNGRIGRDLYALCREAGFRSVEPSVYVLTSTEWGPGRFPRRMADMMIGWLKQPGTVPAVPTASVVSGGELERWQADLAARAAEGRFFYSVNRYICRCER